MDPQKPDPKEMLQEAAARDGQRMLDQIQAEKIKKEGAIVGPDGQPVQAEKVEPVQAVEDPKEKEKQAIAEARKRVQANAEKISEIFRKLPDSERCAATALQAWRLLFWAMNELSTYEGMTPELIQQVSDSMRASALSGGYDISVLRVEIERKAIPFLKDKIRDYAAEQRKRKAAIERVERQIGRAGIALPGHSLKEAVGGKFGPGKLLVVHGPADAVRTALVLISRTSLAQNGSAPFYLSAVEGEQDGDWAETVMPPAWWRNAATEAGRLETTLDPVLDEESVLVLVEGLETLYVTDGTERHPMERKNRALARLYEWAVNHLVAVVVGDPTDEDVPDKRVYGTLPSLAVRLQELDGRPHIAIGNDCLLLENK